MLKQGNRQAKSNDDKTLFIKYAPLTTYAKIGHHEPGKFIGNQGVLVNVTAR